MKSQLFRNLLFGLLCLGLLMPQMEAQSKKELKERIEALEKEVFDLKKEFEKLKTKTISTDAPDWTNPSFAPRNITAPEEATSITFQKNSFDFGTITEGDKVTHTFRFTNTGDKPLTISNARASCGCTVPKFPKESIMPGKKGEIDVLFNSKGKKGTQTKYITITANTVPSDTKLTIKANIITKD